MGQKVHPIGMRLGITKEWTSTWYAGKKDYAKFLNNDVEVRRYLRKELAGASVSRIQIERPAGVARVIIHTARPGIVIGRKGSDIERLRVYVSNLMGVNAEIRVAEIRKPELDALLVAESVAQQIERRVMFRRAMKRAVMNTMRLGAKGIKITVSGRLNGAEIARTEWYREGRVPLHTLRADIDYGTARAQTTYGVVGVKVWIFKGEVLAKKSEQMKVAATVEKKSEDDVTSTVNTLEHEEGAREADMENKQTTKKIAKKVTRKITKKAASKTTKKATKKVTVTRKVSKKTKATKATKKVSTQAEKKVTKKKTIAKKKTVSKKTANSGTKSTTKKAGK